MGSDGAGDKSSRNKVTKTKKGKVRGRRDTIKAWPRAKVDDAPADAAPSSKPSKKRTSKRSGKKKKKSKAGKTVDALPAKTLFLTDDKGEIAGMLPKDTLVLVKRGIVRSPGSDVVGVDPRPTQKAFMWLIGRRPGEGLDASQPHQRPALRLVEFLVRASIVDDPKAHAAIDELYYVLCETGADVPRDAPEPLSMSELPGQSHDD